MKKIIDKYFETHLSPDQKKEFFSNLSFDNLRRIFFFAIALGIIYMMLLYIDYLRFQAPALYSAPKYDILLYIHLSGILFFIFAIIITVKKESFRSGKSNPMIMVYSILIFFAVTGPIQDILTFEEQRKSIMYLSLILIANWGIDIKHDFRLGITSLFFILNLIAVSIVGRKAEILFTLEIYEMVGFTLGVFIFGTINYNRRVSKFRDEKLLEKEKHKIEELEKFKSQMYTNLAHEFRTPLTVINGMTELVKDQINDKNYLGANDFIDTIDGNSKELLKLINQMLTLAKLESKTMKLNLVDADFIGFCKHLIIPFQRVAIEKNIHLDFRSEKEKLITRFDTTKMQTILSNLINNAIKFSTDDGIIKLIVEVENELILAKVSDSGYGIAKEHFPFIFDRYYRPTTGPTRKTAGTGIGLALCKEFVELMEGSIEVESQLGSGTMFTVRIPLIEAEFSQVNDQISIPDHDPSEGNHFHHFGLRDLPLLLIIDDSKDVLDYLVKLLENDYIIELAEDGLEGQAKAEKLIPDVIICDIMMPKKDGITLCSELKADERTNHIPIILLTGKSEEKDKIKGLESGADAYLVKPFKKEELFVRLDQLTELRKRLKEKYSQMVLLEEAQKNKPEDKFIHKVNAIIENELDNEILNVDLLSGRLYLSRMQLHRKLKALSGKSASNYIRSYRLYKSRKMLSDRSFNITDVAFNVGFKDPNYFSKSFHNEFGVSPKEFREGNHSN